MGQHFLIKSGPRPGYFEEYCFYAGCQLPHPVGNELGGFGKCFEWPQWGHGVKSQNILHLKT